MRLELLPTLGEKQLMKAEYASFALHRLAKSHALVPDARSPPRHGDDLTGYGGRCDSTLRFDEAKPNPLQLLSPSDAGPQGLQGSGRRHGGMRCSPWHRWPADTVMRLSRSVFAAP
jgi:hypothetical protein